MFSACNSGREFLVENSMPRSSTERRSDWDLDKRKSHTAVQCEREMLLSVIAYSLTSQIYLISL